MIDHVVRQATMLGWFSAAATANSTACAAVREKDDTYEFEPQNVRPDVQEAIARLGEGVALTMASQITEPIFKLLTANSIYLPTNSSGGRIPIVESLEHVDAYLVQSSRACIVRNEGFVLVWSDQVDKIIEIGQDVQREFLFIIFGQKLPRSISTARLSRSAWSSPPYSPTQTPAYTNSVISGVSSPIRRGDLDDKLDVYSKAIKVEEHAMNDDDTDIESASSTKRPKAILHTFIISAAILLVILSQTLGISKLINEYMWDGEYLRFLITLTIPPLTLFSLFFFIYVVGSFCQMVMPLGSCLKNTKFHSAIKPRASHHRDYELPHITIQMPVYKEGLRGVIVPTIISLMAAIEHYEQQGGTASVFVNDDGLQTIEPELAEARKHYYNENGIAYCARLPNMKGKAKAGRGLRFWKSKEAVTIQGNEEKLSLSQTLANSLKFVRQGKFKKASNMNYALDFSNRVEDELLKLQAVEKGRRGCSDKDLTTFDDDELYEQALANILAADGGKTWAAGNVRIGELILIIDCDTRVPEDCLLYGALEMRESPEVAILQHSSGVMQVANHTFENAISYFTNLVYTSIKYGVGTGDVAPFVGHNAFLRWKAIQSISYVDESDGLTKWWSEKHVSEDFDISLRLQMENNIVRLATYHNGGFKEGVSLTVFDEITRWEKYAYGCNELVFNPLHQWIYKGPVTRLFLRFLWSNMPVTSKTGVIAYIFTYYALASTVLLTTVNYIVVGLFAANIDHDYLPSFSIWLSLIVVFNLVSSISFSILRHRLNESTYTRALYEAFKWLPFFIIFFSGLGLNCAKALLCHAFGMNIEWTSTAKEMGPTGFNIRMSQICKQFKWNWALILTLCAGMIYLSEWAPYGWDIHPGSNGNAIIAIAPLAMQLGCAFLLPIVLGWVS